MKLLKNYEFVCDDFPKNPCNIDYDIIDYGGNNFIVKFKLIFNRN